MQDIHGLNTARTIIMCTAAYIPGIEMAAHKNNFIRISAAPYLAHDIITGGLPFVLTICKKKNIPLMALF